MNGDKFRIDTASFSDTGQWKLVIFISKRRLRAALVSLVNDQLPLLVLSDKEWEGQAEVLPNIEEAIYENPRILDDFATQIIIEAPETLWIPLEFTQDDEYDPSLYTAVYPSRQEDIFSISDDNQLCLFTLIPGLKSFLNRTLPGCRINSSVNVFKQWFEKRERKEIAMSGESAPRQTIGTVVYGDNAYIYAYRDGNFCGGALHPWLSPADIAYKAMLTLRACGFDDKETSLYIMSQDDIYAEISGMLSEITGEISHFTLPRLTLQENIEPAMALLLTNE